jgi:predicted lipoprotein with Yx(FWY)xxD motif
VRASMTILLAALLVSACGTSSSSSSSAAAPASQSVSPQASSSGTSVLVKTGSSSKLGGTILVNAKGLTLYHLSGEQAGKFICTSAGCMHAWPPLTLPSGGKPSGGVGSLGVVKRPDGTEQVTYKGMPLYTFAQDTAPGDANGQGIRDVGTWSAITTAASKASTPAAPAAPKPASGGYAY